MPKPPDKSPGKLSPATIDAALRRAVEIFKAPAPAEKPAGATIGAALESYSVKAGAPLSSSQTVVRAYRVREVATVLAAFAAAMLALDSEGLATWARRREAGVVQGALLTGLTRVEHALETVGLALPRRALVAASDAAARALGAGEDPLFADAWGLVEGAPYLDAQGDEPAAIPVPDALEGGDQAREGRAAVLLVGDSMFAGHLGAAVAQASPATRASGWSRPTRPPPA